MKVNSNDLSPGTEYVFQFRATDGKGKYSAWSRKFDYTTTLGTVPPNAPTNVQFNVSGTSFIASWDAVTKRSDGSALTTLDHYKVVITDGTTTTSSNVKGTSFEFTYNMNVMAFFGAKGSLTVTVYAIDSYGVSSPASAAVSASMTPPPQPSTPTFNQIPNGVEIVWDGLLANGTSAASLEKIRACRVFINAGVGAFTPSGPYRASILGSQPGSAIVPLPNSSTYSVELVLENSYGVLGPPSTPISVTAGSIPVAQIQDQTITSAMIVDGAIKDLDLSVGAVTDSKIADNAVIARTIKAGEVKTYHMVAGTIDAGVLTAQSITATQIAALTITGDKIVGNSIAGDKITANTMTGDRIIANTLSGATIIAGTLAADAITTGTLSAQVTLTGRITTSLGNPHVELNSSGLYSYDGSGNILSYLDASGNGRFTGSIGTTDIGGGKIVMDGATSVLWPIVHGQKDNWPSIKLNYPGLYRSAYIALALPTDSAQYTGPTLEIVGPTNGSSTTNPAGISLSGPSTPGDISSEMMLWSDNILAQPFHPSGSIFEISHQTFEVDSNSTYISSPSVGIPGLILAGETTVNPAANTATLSPYISFNPPFSNTPNVVACAASGSSQVQNVSVTNVTNSGFNVVLTRTNTTATGVYWIAVAPQPPHG